MKKRGQIYIFPTKMGGYFNGLIFLMFLLSIGYSNNLLLIFTLFLFGLNLLWVIQTHFHLQQLKFDRISVSDGHAGDPVLFKIQWKKSPKGPYEWHLRLETDRGPLMMRNHVQDQNQCAGELVWNERGVYEWQYLAIASERPFGLYKAWRYVRIEGRSHSYPALSKALLTTPLTDLGLEGERETGAKGVGDFLDLLPYPGGEARKISWKHYAQTGNLLIKEGEEQRAPMARFRWIDMGSQEKEEALSRLATQMVLCQRQSVPFVFEIEGVNHGPSFTPRHLTFCLEELTLC
jgi:uncharacterized protein (DUF58 family)